MKTLILMSALPGSGKSTWARTFAAKHKDENMLIVASDDIRKELTGNQQNFTRDKEMWGIYLQRIHDFAAAHKDCYVIADSTNLTNFYRRYYFEQTPEYDRHVIVIINCPYEIAVERNKNRSPDKVVPEYAMIKLHEEWEDPNQETVDLYDECIVVGDPFPGLK